MEPISLVLSALVATLVALLTGLTTRAGANPMASTLAAFAALAALNPVTPVLAAPALVPASRFEAVVNGLPSCAKPAMNLMLSRAVTFDCGPRADGTLDVACLCKNKPFKTEAKRAIGEVCHDPADRGFARNWAIARCMDVHLKTNLVALPPAGSLAGNNTSSPSDLVSAGPPSLSNNTKLNTPANSAVSNSMSSTTSMGTDSKAALSEALFDIDDDEDWTADAGMVRPVVTLAVLVAFGVAGMLL